MTDVRRAILISDIFWGIRYVERRTSLLSYAFLIFGSSGSKRVSKREFTPPSTQELGHETKFFLCTCLREGT